MQTRLVTAEDAGIRFDRWFKRHLPAVSHGMVEKTMRKGLVRLNGKRAESSTRIEEGQEIRFPDEWLQLKPTEQKKRSNTWQPTAYELKEIEQTILYEDAHMLIFNKPAGLAVQGGSKQTKNMDTMLSALAQSRGDKRYLLTHRLDQDTSGVLAVAKNSKAASILTQAFASKDVQKIYVALVIGVPKPHIGVIDLPLLKEEKGTHSGSRIEKVGVEEKGKRAITEYEMRDNYAQRLSWVELRPITGRTHQLRVHMQAKGHPIVGDGKYGGADAFIQGIDLPEQLHLHAERLILPPLFGKKIDVKAPWPKHMKESKRLLEGGV